MIHKIIHYAGLAGRNSRLRLKVHCLMEKMCPDYEIIRGMKVILMWDNILL